MIVLVHGVPETAAIWEPVRERLDAPSTALSLPGFGVPRPDGFGATKDDYVDWLAGELDAIDEPVDLVGHDWGAGLTFRIAGAHSELVRSWVADVANIAHPDYEWHDFAKVWQTPGEGEAAFEQQRSMPTAELAAGYEALGVSEDAALGMAEALDETMSDCILALYRSATPNVHSDWGPWSPTDAPGMVLSVSDDPFTDPALAAEVADALGARHTIVEANGHFWPSSAPAAAVDALRSFWDGLDS